MCVWVVHAVCFSYTVRVTMANLVLCGVLYLSRSL